VSLRYVLSRDARASRDDRALVTVAVGRVRGGKTVQRRTALRVPGSVRPGRYRLVGCVGSSCRAVGLSVAAAQTQPAAHTTPSGAPTPTTTTTAPAPDPLAPADPRSVAPVQDSAAATTATIGTAGGTLTATGHFVARGSQQLTFPTWNAGGGANGCTIEPAGVDTDTFFVNSLTMQFNLFTEMAPDGRETDVILPPDITLKVNPGLPHEHVLARCPKGVSQTLDMNIWLLAWSVLEQPRLDPSNGAYTFTQLETTGGNAPWAQATFDLTSGMIHQHLEFRLDHTPGA
jgi:hypothetical protein